MPSRPEVTVATRELREEDLERVSLMLARAFDDDPPMMHILPGRAQRRRTLRRMFHITARDVLDHGRGFVTTSPAADHMAAALWLPPGSYPPTGLRALRAIFAFREILWHPWRGIVDGARILGSVDRLHPRHNHWYLEVLGTEPDHQGRGAGSSAICAGLEIADSEGHGCYLETAKPENISWYARHGFEVVEEVKPVRDGPTLWTMWRKPRPEAGSI